jgi:hypothetical protein
MARLPSRPARPSTNHWEADTWLNPLPAPEVHEGGESSWELWHEAARRLDEAFAPTQPSEQAPLSADTVHPSAGAPQVQPLSADELMGLVRRNNRVCPRPAAWRELYHALEGDRYMDLEAPPVEAWIWGKLSDLQKRLRFRVHIEWAERHGKLPQFKRFLDELPEREWLHMGEG